MSKHSSNMLFFKNCSKVYCAVSTSPQGFLVRQVKIKVHQKRESVFIILSKKGMKIRKMIWTWKKLRTFPKNCFQEMKYVLTRLCTVYMYSMCCDFKMCIIIITDLWIDTLSLSLSLSLSFSLSLFFSSCLLNCVFQSFLTSSRIVFNALSLYFCLLVGPLWHSCYIVTIWCRVGRSTCHILQYVLRHILTWILYTVRYYVHTIYLRFMQTLDETREDDQVMSWEVMTFRNLHKFFIN